MSTTNAPVITVVDVDLQASLNDLIAIERECFGAEAYRASDLYYFTRQGFKLRAAVVDGKIVGYSMAQVAWQDCHIGNLAIVPAFQRHGVGQLLLNDLLQAALADPRCLNARLEVARNNDKARRFYEKNKFVEYGVRAHYYPDGQDALLMSKELRPSA
jgi:ribosomal-protein-alanine N-acetyltransferase